MVIVASEGQILMTLRKAVFLLRLLKALLASTRSTASDSWSLNIVRSAWTALLTCLLFLNDSCSFIVDLFTVSQ